jgi:hypothetical protein
VQGVVETDDGLAELLERFLSTSVSQSATERSFPRLTYRLDPRSLEPFIDPETIIDRVRGLAERAEETYRGKALAQFVREFDALRLGQDPNHPSFDEETR